MRRAVRGVAVQQRVQTGDGRVIAAEALTWADPPLPLAWLERQMHGDLLGGGVQVGTMTELSWDGDGVAYRGWVDDEVPEGAEMIRRMEAGTAPNGERFGISIDPDDWAVELIAMDGDEEDGGVLLLAAAGRGAPPARGQMTAAAGDPDPGDSGVLLFTDSSDMLIERYTRLRIRGATACAIGAFSTPGCYLELDPDAAAEEPPAEGEDVPDALPASAALAVPSAPPAAWFAIPEPDPEASGMVDVYGCDVRELLVTQPDGGLAVPLTIGSDGRVFGHAARWGQCHVGYPGTCVTAPESMAAYAHFHHGEVVAEGGERVATGTLAVGCDHAAAELRAPEARDHYAHAGLAWADVRATNGALGVWVSGVLRPDVTEAQLRLLRASSLSGDWRRIGNNLEFIGALAVSVPGFPISREAVVAAALTELVSAALVASAYVDEGVQTSLVAAGVVQRCTGCQERDRRLANARRAGDPRLDEALRILRHLDSRTRHLVPVQAAADLGVIRRNTAAATATASTAAPVVRPPLRRPR